MAESGVQLQPAYSAWQVARADIYQEWQAATDPANLQPKIKPSLRAAAIQLRSAPPPGVTIDELNRLVEAVEAPWGTRIESQIRSAIASLEGQAASIAIAEVVKKLGLEPFKAPEPLPPIDITDVRLVCWMKVDATTPSTCRDQDHGVQ